MNSFSPIIISLRILSALTCTLALVGWLVGPMDRLSAQNAPELTPSQPTATQRLTEGLLDLLTEPSNANQPASPARQLTPAEVGLDGEDLGEASENPLQAVRQSMLIAAAFLRRDGPNAETLRLQSDIVTRLDDLISQLEKSQAQKESSQQSSQQQASNQSKSGQRQPQPMAPKRTRSKQSVGDDQSESDREPGEQQGEPENVAQRSVGSLSVELSDPKSLQQDVWGQLPARVRQQMQSRMVEQFLPAYREQIEAYFRTLLK